MEHNPYKKTDANVQSVKDKMQCIANAVMDILVKSSQEKEKLSTDMITRKLLEESSVYALLLSTDEEKDEENGIALLQQSTINIFEKLSRLLPGSRMDQLNEIKDNLSTVKLSDASAEWIEQPIEMIENHYASIAEKNKELKDFIHLTMKYLADTEEELAHELTSQKQQFKDEKKFADDISSNVNMIKDDVDTSVDFSSFKMAVMNKIENINRGIERKKEQDILRVQETEKTIEDMSRRMTEIKDEAAQLKKKSDEIEYESLHDNLTGLYNRRAYDLRITETLANLERYNVPASLMICDIDYFKKINDTYGHKVGDLALKKLASLLQERLRVNDFIARYGGEEFAIILPHTDLNSAIHAGEGTRSYIDKFLFSYKGDKIPLTISVGISSFRKGDDCNSAFERADNALYLAKESGRNQVKSEKDVLTDELSLKTEPFKI